MEELQVLKISRIEEVAEKCWYTSTCLYLANKPYDCPHHLSGGRKRPESPYTRCTYFAKQLGKAVVEQCTNKR